MITRSAVFRVKDRLRNELGQAQIARLDAIANLLAEDGRASLAAVLEDLYPGLPRETALSNFRQFRLILNTAAKQANVRLALETDGQNKRSAPESRAVWFTGDDEITEGLNQIIEAEEYGLQRTSQTAVRLGTVTYDFARANGEGDDLIRELETHFKAAATHEFIRKPGAECDLIIELVSPAYLATRPSREWVCRVVPVLYKEIDELNTNQRGLERLKKFTFDGSPWTSAKRPKSVSALFADICRVCAEPWVPALALPECDPLPHYVRSHGVPSKLDKQQAEPLGERREALEFLHDWCGEPSGPRYCALVGETGIGKTTTVQKLASERKTQQRQTIYLDLRLLGQDAAEKDIELTRILDIILAKSWKSGSVERLVKPLEAIKLVRDHGALVIFDGLDEVLVHLPPTQGQHFTRELFRILPPSVKSHGKMLITCRSNFFRTFRDQVNHLTAESRDNINKQDYLALVLLPFTENQIRESLKITLPANDPDRVLELLKSVHNLREMAERPYTLSLITNQIHRLEQWKAAGEKVTGYRLYGHMVLEWLERDAGKHTLTTDHKQAIMEYFAAELWKSGRKTWKIGDIETWLLKFLRANDDINIHYEGVSRELLKEDLRTATFLVRDGGDEFRFAHTSLQEYFLAGYLRRALLESALDRWAIPRVSAETLDFLGQALDPNEIGPLKALRDNYTPLASELGFEYYMVASKGGYPRINGSGFQLQRADLSGRMYADADLPKIDLTGANLRHSVWENINLREGNFGNANAPLAEFHACDLEGAIFERVDLTAAVFRRSNLHRAIFREANEYHAQRPGIPSASLGTLIPQAGHSNSVWSCACSPDSRRAISGSADGTIRVWDAATAEARKVLDGHTERVTSCSFSQDGTRVLSASDDTSLRLWNVETGECLSIFQGHSAAINACTFSPDGSRVLSASDDMTLRIWDVETGETVFILSGHSRAVTGCAFSPDGSLILSCSHDSSLRVWEVDTGAALRELHGHSDAINACAFLSDGTRVLSASQDETLVIWDVHSGKSIHSLRGHSAPVITCGVSIDGCHVVSGDVDGTIMVWDAQRGEPVRTMPNPSGAVTCCKFFPDGHHVLSSSDSHACPLSVWDVTRGERIHIFGRDNVFVWGCALSRNGRFGLTACSDSTLALWDLANGQLLRTFRGHSGWVWSCALSADGSLALSGSGDHTLRVWSAPAGETLRTLQGHAGSAFACALSPDDRLALSASRDGTLRLWSIATAETIRTLEGHSETVADCVFSNDGYRALSASFDQTIKVWDVETGKLLRTLHGHGGPVRSCAFSPDGRRALSASDDMTLLVWDVDSGKAVHQLRGHFGIVWDGVFSGDGRRILSASADRTLRIWDVETGGTLRTLRGHSDLVTGCAFSTDGQRAISSSKDGTFRLWDAETGQQVGWQAHHFPDGGTFSVTVDKPQRIISHGPNSWRYIRWEVRNEQGELDLLPSDL